MECIHDMTPEEIHRQQEMIDWATSQLRHHGFKSSDFMVGKALEAIEKFGKECFTYGLVEAAEANILRWPYALTVMENKASGAPRPGPEEGRMPKDFTDL